MSSNGGMVWVRTLNDWFKENLPMDEGSVSRHWMRQGLRPNKLKDHIHFLKECQMVEVRDGMFYWIDDVDAPVKVEKATKKPKLTEEEKTALREKMLKDGPT